MQDDVTLNTIYFSVTISSYPLELCVCELGGDILVGMLLGCGFVVVFAWRASSSNALPPVG